MVHDMIKEGTSSVKDLEIAEMKAKISQTIAEMLQMFPQMEGDLEEFIRTGEVNIQTMMEGKKAFDEIVERDKKLVIR